MKWNDTTLLSTLETISRWEKEVNELAGYDSIPAIQGNKTAKIIDINKSIDSIVYNDSAGISHTSEIKVAGEWDIPEAEINTILYYEGETLFGISKLMEGNGEKIEVLREDGKITSFTLTENVWIISKVNRTWKSKLELAREAVKNDVLTILYNRTDASTDEEALDLITNAETFITACDMKALELIYRDLGLGTFNQMHQMKADTYARAYQNEIASAISRMRVGIDTDTGSLLITSGRVTR